MTSNLILGVEQFRNTEGESVIRIVPSGPGLIRRLHEEVINGGMNFLGGCPLRFRTS